jgi:medium-chain acyl-[acyl-carrier-protein] hydrolase
MKAALERAVVEEQPAMRLFCFPHAGGSAASLNGWLRRLPSQIALERVQLPGRDPDSGERPHTRIERLMPELWLRFADRIDRPFALYGHSLGALVAYEFARYARMRGYGDPVALFVSGRRAPQCPMSLAALYDLPDSLLIERLAEFGGTPDGLMRDPKWRQYLLPALRADLEMSDRYVYRAQGMLHCPIFAFRGRGDSIASEQEMLAWRAQTTGRFSMESLAGSHFLDQDGVERLTGVIISHLLEHETQVRRCEPHDQ